eukprot:302355_1
MASCVQAVLLFLCNIILSTTSQSDVCIWNRAETSTTHINGLYAFNSNNGGASYYEKIDTECADNTVFLYLANNTWHIGETLESTTDYIAICNDTYVEHPTDCGSNWAFVPSGALDLSIQVYDNECPNLEECAEIFLTYSSINGCDECCGSYAYSSNNTDNVYVQKSIHLNSNIFLYFSSSDFRWMCSALSDDIKTGGKCQNLTTSSSVISHQLEPGWSSMEVLQWRQISWSSASNQTAYIQCRSAAPTATPSASPTTTEPTYVPTLQPIVTSSSIRSTTETTETSGKHSKTNVFLLILYIAIWLMI